MSEQLFEKLLCPENQFFIAKNADKNPADIVLSSKNPDSQILAEQILCRQKARCKLPTWCKTDKVLFPSAIAVEQASSETASRYKTEILAGKKLADITGGLGEDSRAFSTVFEKVFYVEKDVKKAAFAKHNFEKMGIFNIETFAKDAVQALQNFADASLDVVFIDPARRNSEGKKVSFLEDCEPDILQILPLCFQKSALILLKASPMLDIKMALKKLSCVRAAHILAIDNECKELLFECENNFSGEPKIVCINIKNGLNEVFSAIYAEEEADFSGYSPPLTYIFEPNVAVLKAGFFKTFAKKIGLKKLAKHTHLYTSSEIPENFLGKIFRLKEILPADKKILEQKIPARKANFIAKNYPLSAEELAKKFKFTFGGNDFLIAASYVRNENANAENSLIKNLLFAEKIS
jgi:16S rRNA G966 N2-methylase RsmD